ncbi:hypothetical protein P4O66_014763, partial [Electrophorus voltai]
MRSPGLQNCSQQESTIDLLQHPSTYREQTLVQGNVFKGLHRDDTAQLHRASPGLHRDDTAQLHSASPGLHRDDTAQLHSASPGLHRDDTAQLHNASPGLHRDDTAQLHNASPGLHRDDTAQLHSASPGLHKDDTAQLHSASPGLHRDDTAQLHRASPGLHRDDTAQLHSASPGLHRDDTAQLHSASPGIQKGQPVVGGPRCPSMGITSHPAVTNETIPLLGCRRHHGNGAASAVGGQEVTSPVGFLSICFVNSNYGNKVYVCVYVLCICVLVYVVVCVYICCVYVVCFICGFYCHCPRMMTSHEERTPFARAHSPGTLASVPKPHRGRKEAKPVPTPETAKVAGAPPVVGQRTLAPPKLARGDSPQAGWTVAQPTTGEQPRALHGLPGLVNLLMSYLSQLLYLSPSRCLKQSFCPLGVCPSSSGLVAPACVRFTCINTGLSRIEHSQKSNHTNHCTMRAQPCQVHFCSLDPMLAQRGPAAAPPLSQE